MTDGGAYLRPLDSMTFFLSIVSLITLALFGVESVNCNVVFWIAKVEQIKSSLWPVVALRGWR